jgi:REP element-mobilizing transposase RayT
MDVFFSTDDRQEYFDLLSQSASKHALAFRAWCLMSNHAHRIQFNPDFSAAEQLARQESLMLYFFSAVASTVVA